MPESPIPPAEEPQVPIEPQSPKPKKIRPVTYIVFGGMILVILVCGVFVLSGLGGMSQSTDNAPKRTLLPSAAGDNQLKRYHEDTDIQIKGNAERNGRSARDAAHRAAAAFGEAPDQNPDANVPPDTPAQARAKALMDESDATEKRQAAATAREDRRQKREQALRTGMVPIDFTGKSRSDGASERRASGERAALSDEEVQQLLKADSSGGGEVRPTSGTSETKAPLPPPKPQVPEKVNKYPWATYTGKLYVLFEGKDSIECALANRLDGERSGPVIVKVTTPVYSQNRETLLIPVGTSVIGWATKVEAGEQRRLAVSFHRMIMAPDGYPVDLDQFIGLDQIGATGLTDKVNNHYVKMFGFSLALGAIAGMAQIGNSTSGFGYSPSVSIRNGMSEQISQEATQVMSRGMNILPSLTVHEGNRVKIWLTNDLWLPAVANHVIDPNL